MADGCVDARNIKNIINTQLPNCPITPLSTLLKSFLLDLPHNWLTIPARCTGYKMISGNGGKDERSDSPMTQQQRVLPYVGVVLAIRD